MKRRWRVQRAGSASGYITGWLAIDGHGCGHYCTSWEAAMILAIAGATLDRMEATA